MKSKSLNLLFILALLLGLSIGCSKSSDSTVTPASPADAFVGTWRGSISYSGLPGTPMIVTITKESDTKLAISTGGPVYKATISGDAFYQSNSDYFDGRVILIETKGTVQDGKLTMVDTGKSSGQIIFTHIFVGTK